MNFLKESLDWAKNNKGKVVASIGAAIVVNDGSKPLGIGMIITGLVMEIRKHKKEKDLNYE